MSIRICLHQTHRQYTDGQETVDVEGRTVAECLTGLIDRYPALQPHLFDSGGGLKPTIEIYLNHQSAFPGELAKNTEDGDTIHVVRMLAGG